MRAPLHPVPWGAFRPADAARLVLGGVLLAAPGPFITAAGSSTGVAVRRTVRVLGVRYLVQAAAGSLVHRPWVRAADTGVDVVHAASMIGFAHTFPAHRKLALSSAAIAVVLAGLDVSEPTG